MWKNPKRQGAFAEIRSRAILDPAVILSEGDIEDPMEPIFNRPVTADRLNQHRGIIVAA
jgi:hypothetical protein